jgi:type IV pilus assembly protein PilB
MGTYARQFSRRLGEILLEEGLITVDQLQQALKRQYMAGQSLSESLVRMKALTETDIARVISRELGCPYLDASRYDIPPEILHLIPVDVAVECLILPLDRIGRSLLLACTGSVPAEILDAIARRSKLRVFLCIATPSQILEAIKRNGSRLLEAIRHDYETKTHAGAAGTA